MTVAAHIRKAFQIEPDSLGDDGRLIRPTGAAGLAKHALNRICRALVTRGLYLPGVQASAATCRRYWASRVEGEPNAPSSYAEKDTGIVDFLDTFWRPEVAPEMSVVELGTNAGANLARLRELGYGPLTGVEINPAAVDAMRVAFPSLADVEISVGSLEAVLPEIADGAADVVFTMAVLIHVHPTSMSVFSNMVRIARRFVCVVEHEEASNVYVFPRDYRRAFERLGCRQVRAMRITAAHPELPDYRGYTARLFATR